MGRKVDFLDVFDLMWGDVASPGLFDKVERSFWLELSRAPVLDAVEEMEIEARRYGPVLATTVAALPHEPLFNRVLGAAEPGAVDKGHLEEALDWVESVGVECRVPVTLDRGEAGVAEDLLNRRGYRRAGSRVRFVRESGPPDFPELPGIKVVEIGEDTEGFSDFPGRGLDLDLLAYSFLDCLPRRDQWRCYLAYDKDGKLIASASMFLHWEVALLDFAATSEDDCGKGAHLALLRRRIQDAHAAQCHTIYAETEELPGELDGPSPAARNLVRAGFKQAAVRPVWRNPE